MICPTRMRYSSNVTGCPATCLDRNPDPLKCHQPSNEGCECIPGYVLSGKECVPLHECGCEYEQGYLPVTIQHAYQLSFVWDQ